MDDYQETHLHEPDPPLAAQRALKRRRVTMWALYIVTAVVLLIALLSGTFRLW
jgi:type VI protein secretion system component VasF